MRTIKTYSNRAPFYNALIRHFGGSRIRFETYSFPQKANATAPIRNRNETA
jgi:hypothetical protein